MSGERQNQFLPYVGWAIAQGFSVMFLPIALADFLIFMEGSRRIIFASVFGAIFIADVTLFVLSFTRLWNSPIAFDQEGIVRGITKHKTRFRWDEAVQFEVLPRLVLITGLPIDRLNARIRIRFLNGSKLAFQPTSPMIKALTKVCADEPFLYGLEATLFPWGIDLREDDDRPDK